MNNQGEGSFVPGAIIGHRYEILRPLRSETHGMVMLARDQVLDIDVGLKVLSNEHPEFARLLEYYRREALWGLRLHHPQILGVHHLDETTDGVFLIQEPFAGNSLGELLGHSEALTINDSLYFIEVLAQGVAFAQKQGVNHQNFNPQQVLVSATDGIKIINFAFPAELQEIQTVPEIQAYIAPEVWEGRHPSAASNLFSLGVIGYRMLTGAFPFPLRPDGKLPYPISSDLAEFDKIPEPLRPLFTRCLKSEPEKRFQTAADLLPRLAALREQLTPANAVKTRQLKENISGPVPLSREPAPKPIIGPPEPEVEIDSGWQEAGGFPRQNFRDKLNTWFQDQQHRMTEFFGPEPLRNNRNKQAAAAIGLGLALLFLVFGLSSLFSPKPKLKMVKQPESVTADTATPALQSPPPANPPVMAAAPSAPQEVKPDTINHPKSAPAKPSTEENVPLATPLAVTPKKPELTAKPEKPASQPASNAAAAKALPSETLPKLVATLDKEKAARKKADALTKQGRKAIVKKVKKGDKTIYQVWIMAGAVSPTKHATSAKPATSASKPKAAAKSNSASSR